MFWDGVPTGTFVHADESGSKTKEVVYQRGHLNGIARYFIPTGRLMKLKTFGNGYEHGFFCEWDDSGMLLSDGYFDAFSALRDIMYYHPSGSVAETGKLFEGKRVGEWVSWPDELQSGATYQSDE